MSGWIGDMMSKEKKRKVKKTKPKKVKKLSHVLKSTIGRKTGMNLLETAFREVGQTSPRIDDTLKSPMYNFLLACYARISDWDENHSETFLLAVTDLKPSKSMATRLRQIKTVIHEIFNVDEDDWESPAATWKMWPHKGNEPKKERKMASKAATKKKATAKKASKKVTKKTAAKKEDARVGKKASEKATKKTATKKTASKKKSGGTRLAPITPATKVIRVNATTKEGKAAWDGFLKSMGVKKQTFKALCDAFAKKSKMDEAGVRRIFGSLRRRGYVKTVD